MVGKFIKLHIWQLFHAFLCVLWVSCKYPLNLYKPNNLCLFLISIQTHYLFIPDHLFLVTLHQQESVLFAGFEIIPGCPLRLSECHAYGLGGEYVFRQRDRFADTSYPQRIPQLLLEKNGSICCSQSHL